MPPLEFNAPWTRSLRTTSAVSTGVLLGVIVIGFSYANVGFLWLAATIVLPALVLIAGILCVVRGYTLTEREILIRRGGWTRRLSLQDLRSVEGQSEALLNSIRLFANGGLFSLSGFYWSRRLKTFHAYATDPSRAVILRYPHKTIIVTPHDPQQFIVRVRTYLQTNSFPA